MEEHIVITNGSIVEYNLIPKDTVPEGFEEFEILEDTGCLSAANSSTNLSREMSMNSAAYNSDSDVGKFFSQQFFLQWLENFLLFFKLLDGRLLIKPKVCDLVVLVVIT